jgi:hypothetical protein
MQIFLGSFLLLTTTNKDYFQYVKEWESRAENSSVYLFFLVDD